MKTGRAKTVIVVCSALVPAILILFIFLVQPNATKVFSQTSEQTQSIRTESKYRETVNATLSKIDFVSDKIEKLGLEVMAAGTTVGQVTQDLHVLENQLASEESDLEQIQVPDKFSGVNTHLAASVHHMQKSLNSLSTTFEKLEKLREGKLPLFFISSMLGANSTTQLFPLYQIVLINDTEREQITNARASFADSLAEGSEMKKELDSFLASAPNFNAKSYSKYDKSLSYFAGAGGCGCSLPLNFSKNS